MAKIKNTGNQPRGFHTADGGHVTVPPGSEADVNMTEADFKHLKKLIEDHDDPKPFEISGSHEAEAKKKEKSKDEGEMPAQSTEPPPAPATPQVATPAVVEKTREHQKEAPPAHRK